MNSLYQIKVEELTQHLVEVIVNNDRLMKDSEIYALNKLRLKYGVLNQLIVDEQLEEEYYELVSLYQRKILKRIMKII